MYRRGIDQRTSRPSPRAFPKLESLENRTLLATCNVTRLGDFGAGGTIGDFSRGDLRFCINHANATPGEDLILFQVNGTINLQSALPDLTDDLIILGPGPDQLTVQRDPAATAFRIFNVPWPTGERNVQIYSLTITNGLSTQEGAIRNFGTMTLGDVVVTGNSGVFGGGIYNKGDLFIYQSTISGNFARGATAGRGGGIYNDQGGTLIVADSTIADNTAEGSFVYYVGAGGGIYNAGTAEVYSTTIADNTVNGKEVGNGNAYAEGGAIYNHNTGSLTVESSTMASNALSVSGGCNFSFYAWAFGAGVSNWGTATIRNSTISQNEAINTAFCEDELTYGAGVYNGGTLTLRHSTIAGNSGQNLNGYARGGGLYAGGTVNLRNTILGGNGITGTGASGGPDLYGTLASSGYNLISNSSGGFGYAATDILDADPMLGPLADNGGPTQTMALLPGSPAIDAGDNADAPEFDQRGPGFPRIVNAIIDIGSFEVQSTGASTPLDNWAILISADFGEDVGLRRGVQTDRKPIDRLSESRGGCE